MKILERPVILEYCHSIQNCFCPICNVQGNLNRIKTTAIAGMGFMYVKQTKYFILCEKCAKLKARKASIASLTVGLFTILPPIMSVMNNIDVVKIYKNGNTPSSYMEEFVIVNYKLIEPIKDNPFALSTLIRNSNPIKTSVEVI